MTRRHAGLAALLLHAALLPGASRAATCYTGAQLAPIAKVEAAEVFVMVDQTTALPPSVVAYLRSIVAAVGRPGTRISLFSFSAYTTGQYFQPRGSYFFEAQPSPSETANIGVQTQRNLRQCLANQAAVGARLLGDRLSQIVGPAAVAVYANSDIMGSLRQIGPRLAASHARSRTLVLVSDMLQNMPGNSFYAKGRLRAIDPGAELRNATATGQLADLANATVYIVGAALGGRAPDNQIRTPREINALEQFWRGYVARSHGRLAQFGTPLPAMPTP
ncbi:MAG: hypothetical protein E7773_04750 [Sphingomonas sp.]|uniref:hypothetical protein n=1 Tax=Sphingomonas sp. TaxID=28214 RepID=UPI0012249711|nr:hypothetical protein [Sphingomonas sp.]THD37337.1 MAG: hypothetical protein E7773_04750 [Sphingomonas sp.]